MLSRAVAARSCNHIAQLHMYVTFVRLSHNVSKRLVRVSKAYRTATLTFVRLSHNVSTKARADT